MLRIKQSPKLPPEIRRGQILDAAHKLFDKRGYRATTIDDIAEYAGLTKGAVYYHFKSKETILKNLVQCVLNAWIDAFTDIPKGSFTPGELLSYLKEIDQNMPMHHASHNLSILSEIMQIPSIHKIVDEGYIRIIDAAMVSLNAKFVKSREHRRQLTIFTFLFYDGFCWATNMKSRQVDFKKQLKLFSSLFLKDSNRSRKGILK